MISPKEKQKEERRRVRSHGPNYPGAPIIGWRNSVATWGKRGTMEQKAIDRWENEGGEIPHEQQKQSASVRDAAVSPGRY
jgi:hypothetical protein